MITTFQGSPVATTEIVSSDPIEVSTLYHGVLGYVIEVPIGKGFIAFGMSDVSHIHLTEEGAINWLFVLWTNKGFVK